jgi:hypothetical protein
MPRRLILSFAAMLALAAVVACGGDGRKSSDSASGAAAPPGAVLDRVDVAKSVAALAQLKSFRFDMSLKLDFGALLKSATPSTSGDEQDFAAALLGLLGAFSDIKASGAVIAPDQADVRATFLGEEFGYIQIGKQAWVREGGKWSVTEPDNADLGFEPQDLVGGILPDQVLKVAKTSSEKVNGVQATRYSFDKSALQGLASSIGPGLDFSSIDQASLDLWLNSDNIPVKLVMNLVAKTEKGEKFWAQMEMNITNINDSSIKIVPPI